MSKQPSKIVAAPTVAAAVVTEQAQQEAQQAQEQKTPEQEVQQTQAKEPEQQEVIAGAIEEVVEKPSEVKPVAVEQKPAAPVVTAGASKGAVLGVGNVVKAAAVPTGATLDERLEKILKNVPAAHRVDIVRITQYCKTMAPGKPVGEKNGIVEQAALYRSIQNIINRQEAYFTELFTALLAIFSSERNASLGDRHRNRFMESANLSKADRAAFQNITHLLTMLAPATTREQALKQVNLERALSSGLTADGQRRVLQFFGA